MPFSVPLLLAVAARKIQKLVRNWKIFRDGLFGQDKRHSFFSPILFAPLQLLLIHLPTDTINNITRILPIQQSRKRRRGFDSEYKVDSRVGTPKV